MTRPGRSAQKDRTRRAIVDGARRLMQEGRPVTVTAAAEVHGISKATAYRYFSDSTMLEMEAGLDIEVLGYEAVTAGAQGLRDALLQINLYFLDLALANERNFRRFVGMTLLAWTDARASGPSPRGGRRIAMYLRALHDHPPGLPPQTAEALMNALSVATGTEAMIALLDVAGTSPDAARATVKTVTGAILDRFLGPA